MSNNVNEVIWKPVKGFEGLYEISDTGHVRGLNRRVNHKNGSITINARLLKPRVKKWGYLEVRLSKNANAFTKFIHILLAEAFIPNPENKKEVNHKNGKRLDNSLSNLEWVTHSENVKHAYDNGLIKLKVRPVIDTCSGDEYKSVKEAAKACNVKYNTLRNYLSGNIKNNKTCLQYAA
jgi:NUMOD4 motif/HNH endonuclease